MSDEAEQNKPHDAEKDWQRVDRYKEFLEALEPANRHFQESGRQLLLGSSSAMTALSALLDAEEAIPAGRHVASGMILIRSIIDLWIARIPSALDDRTQILEARLEALCNLRAVIQAEKLRRAGQADESGAKNVLEALDAILKGINEEIERETASAERTAEDASSRYEVKIGDNHE